jgi:phosphoglucosamine mutase
MVAILAAAAIVFPIVVARLFGTDGMRGKFGHYPILPGVFSRLAWATEAFFSKHLQENYPKIAIGRDTRESGSALVQALIAGFSSDVTVLECGILPTPAVAYVVRKFGCDCGLSVTASHNPYSDNGVKIFNARGEKLSIDLECSIEKLLQSSAANRKTSGANVLDYSTEAKREFCAPFDDAEFRFNGRVVLDVANGAGVVTSPIILKKICKNLVITGDKPDGRNINVGCGSEHIGTLCNAVRNFPTSIGIAHDGDADRLIMVDESGEPVKGDQILGIIAKYLFGKNRLRHNLVVATEQSNSGLDSSLAKLGIGVMRCEVGDRNVYNSMLKHDASLGGEESGHLILREFSNTGDAISAAVLVLKIMAESGLRLSLLKTDISLLPQKLCNIQVRKKIPLHEIEGFSDLLDSLKKSEPNYGRVFARYSGTEDKLRLLVEAKSEAAVDKILTCVYKFLGCKLT